MPGVWSVVLPLATTNLLKDPSFEFGTLATYWTTDVGGGTGTAALDTTRTFFGANAVKLVGGTQYSAVYQSVTTSALTYIISAYVYTDGSAVTSADFKFVIDGAAATPDSFTSVGGGWYRAVRSQSETAAAHNTGVRALASKTCYVDGVQFEQQSGVTTYCDGEQSGCSWSGTVHGSSSSRDAQSRAGGQVVNLDTYTSYVESMAGAGMPPLRNIATPYALLDGALYQRSIAQPRVITLLTRAQGTSLPNLLATRQSLIDACKPDAVKSAQAILLQYTGGSYPSYLSAIYDGGLDIQAFQGFTDQFPWRFIAYDPYWFSEGDEGAVLTTNVSLSAANCIAQRSAAGLWSAMGTGTDVTAPNQVQAIVRGPDGTIYVGGAFTTMGGVASTSRIAKWDGSAWSALGTGAADGTVQWLALDANGTLYAGGSFSGMGGVASTRGIAKWNGSAWSALGTGAADNTVYVIRVGNDGTLYAGGTFSGMGGIANTNGIAKWNGSAWSALATGIDGAQSVRGAVIGKDGYLYVGGTFTAVSGVSATRVAKWNLSAWSALGSGASAEVDALEVGADGSIYIGGQFATAGGVTVNKVAKWTGVQWLALGNGVSGGNVYAMHLGADGILYVGGSLTGAGDVALADGMARWNGTTWLPIDINPPGTATAYAFLSSPDGKLYIGYDQRGSANTPGITTLTNNGKAAAYPIIKLTGAGIIYQIVNYTTGDALYFKGGISLQTGETVTLDLRPGIKTIVSSFRGSVFTDLLESSNPSLFRLLPGSNSLSVFTSSASTTSVIYWRKRHWSVDGGA